MGTNEELVGRATTGSCDDDVKQWARYRKALMIAMLVAVSSLSVPYFIAKDSVVSLRFSTDFVCDVLVVPAINLETREVTHLMTGGAGALVENTYAEDAARLYLAERNINITRPSRLDWRITAADVRLDNNLALFDLDTAYNATVFGDDNPARKYVVTPAQSISAFGEMRKLSLIEFLDNKDSFDAVPIGGVGNKYTVPRGLYFSYIHVTIAPMYWTADNEVPPYFFEIDFWLLGNELQSQVGYATKSILIKAITFDVTLYVAWSKWFIDPVNNTRPARSPYSVYAEITDVVDITDFFAGGQRGN